MIKFLLSLLKAGFAGVAALLLFAVLAMPADEARADDGHPGGGYPLHQAAGEDGDLAMVVHLLGNAHRIDVNAKNDDSGDTPLHNAAYYGRVTIVATLIAAGADVKARNMFGAKPLHWAAKYGHASVAPLLLAAGADVNAKVSQDFWVWVTANIQSVTENIQAASGLLQEMPQAILQSAGGAGRATWGIWVVWVVFVFLVGGFIFSQLLNPRERSDTLCGIFFVLCLFFAASYVVRVNNNTPLHLAAEQGHASVALVLLAAGAYVNAKDDYDETPLHSAASEGHASIVSALLAAGAYVNAKNDDDETPLHHAALFGHESIASELLAAGADVNAEDDDDETPLHRAVYNAPTDYWSAYDGDHASVVTTLLAAGANVNAKNDDDETPLHHAALFGHESIASELLAAGADVNAEDDDDETPLHRAVYFGNTYAASVLLAAGANVNAKVYGYNPFGRFPWPWVIGGTTPLDIAKRKKNRDVVALLERHVRAIPQKPGAEIGSAESVYENAWRSVVVVVAGDTQGGGVIVGGANQVATNCHVVDESPNDIRVYKGAERRAVRDAPYSAEIVAGDRERDVCLLSVAGLWGIAAGVRRAGDLAVGEAVYAVGAPQGFDFSISNGIVSQLRILANESAPLIQTSAAISPGSSGGGLFDSQGRLVGLTIWKIREGENLNFAVPIDWALELPR